MVDNRGIDTDLGWVNRKLEQLQRQIEALRSERRAAATTITDGDLRVSGGGSLIVDGGDFLLLDTDSSTVFRLGPQIHGDRGVSLLRIDGTEALAVRKRFAGSTDQSIGVYDRNGKQMLVEEELGDGFAAPAFPIPVQPRLATSGAVNAGPHGLEVSTTSGSFVTTHLAQFFRQNQYLRMRIAVAASDTTTAAEVQVINTATGLALRPFLAAEWLGVRAAGSTAYTILQAGSGVPLVAPGAFGDLISLEVQVRRTAGSGTLTAAVPFASGSSGAAY
ncbi:MAG TPA: hypothetical protein VGE38_07200 [Nocardioides sp.]|uniref:hypothetical protein n=1 Tax=Nocardioides sp. TaxID=35761 RepID=UPI002EDA83AE